MPEDAVTRNSPENRRALAVLGQVNGDRVCLNAWEDDRRLCCLLAESVGA
jgi:hypothetical protein